MPAGMHHAGIAGGIGQVRGLDDRQSIHVGAQADAAVRLAAADRRHHAVPADPRDVNATPSSVSLACTKAEVSFSCKRQFGMRVQMAAPCRQRVRQRPDRSFANPHIAQLSPGPDQP
jgi:hypothetical protein